MKKYVYAVFHPDSNVLLAIWAMKKDASEQAKQINGIVERWEIFRKLKLPSSNPATASGEE